MIVIYLVTALFALLLIPLPVKISTVYDNRLLAIKIYNHKIELQSKHEVKENAKAAISMDINIKPILKFLQKNRLKPSLRLNLKLVYGFGDAAYTGIFYGIIHAVCPFLIELLKGIAKVKKSKMSINPEFDKSIFNLQISSIIFINLVQVIYIAINIIKIIKSNKTFE